MNSPGRLSEELVKLLAEIDFDRRYYGFLETCRDRGKMETSWEADAKRALASTKLEFKYNKKEDFYGYKGRYKNCEMGLNIAIVRSAVELILFVKTAQEKAGGPFPMLARHVGQLRDPDFTPSPPSPLLPFSNGDQLVEVVQFGISLFEDITQTILSRRDWCG